MSIGSGGRPPYPAMSPGPYAEVTRTVREERAADAGAEGVGPSAPLRHGDTGAATG
ncbi:hypothetical protein AB0P17_30305 [Streptomyces sp. NPDC088124]|uniref:hypothetical protein n=1 Tax=Streptomyces sp. NPDC088124 TaxID=3154654 RepID=UPI0034147BAB